MGIAASGAIATAACAVARAGVFFVDHVVASTLMPWRARGDRRPPRSRYDFKRSGRPAARKVSGAETLIMVVAGAGLIAAFSFALWKHQWEPAPNRDAMPSADASSPGRPWENPNPAGSDEAAFSCIDIRVIDGDTIQCGRDSVRLASIDAPEMPGHCRAGRACVTGDPFISRANLQRLTASGMVRCVATDTDRYGRTIAHCQVGAVDLSCAQVRGGFAVVRYTELVCPPGQG
jgi:endonuclease YncB( thermonuclease family)